MTESTSLRIAQAIARSDGYDDWERVSLPAQAIYQRNAHAVEGELDLAPGYPEPPRHWRVTMSFDDNVWTVHVDQGTDGAAWIDADDDPIRALVEHIGEEVTK